MGNLTENVNRNRKQYNDSCSVRWAGYEWGKDTRPVL